MLHSVTYKWIPSGAIILLQISTATLLSLAYMAVLGVGLNVNTLPVQAVGVGIGVDYAIYIVDRIRHEVTDTADIDEDEWDRTRGSCELLGGRLQQIRNECRQYISRILEI